MTGATEKFPKNKWYRQLAGEVSPRAFVIGFVLVENFLFKGQTECWSSQETLARLANASPRTVRDGLRELEDRGFLKHRRGGKGHANRYVPVLFDRQDFAGQNGLDTAFDRQDFAYDDRQDSAADITVQQLKGGAAHAGPATAALWSTVVENVATTSAAPDAGLLPAGRQVFDSSIEPEDEPKSLADLLDELTSLLDDIAEAGLALPEDLQAFLDRDVDPEEQDAVTDLLATAEQIFEAHREAQMQGEQVEPLANRFADPARRASYAERVVAYLCSIPRENRHAAGWRYHRQIVEGLKQTLPRFLAERLAGELRDEIFTEVWRRTRTAAVPAGNVVSLDAHRSRDRHVA